MLSIQTLLCVHVSAFICVHRLGTAQPQTTRAVLLSAAEPSHNSPPPPCAPRRSRRIANAATTQASLYTLARAAPTASAMQRCLAAGVSRLAGRAVLPLPLAPQVPQPRLLHTALQAAREASGSESGSRRLPNSRPGPAKSEPAGPGRSGGGGSPASRAGGESASAPRLSKARL